MNEIEEGEEARRLAYLKEQQARLARVRADALRCKGQKIHIVASAHTQNEFVDDPPWAEFDLTDGLIDDILRGAELCIGHDLADVELWRYDARYESPDEPGEDLRTDLDKLKVYDSMFVFEACIKNADINIESATFYLDETMSFFRDVLAGRRFFTNDDEDDDLENTFKEAHEGAGCTEDA